MTQLAIKWSVSFPPHHTSVSALPGENKTDKICIKVNKKLSNFIFPDMWPPAANLLQGLTVVQQHVYLIGLTFRNIDEFKKRLVKYRLVWSRMLSTLLSINEWRKCLRAEPMFTNQNFKHFYRQLKMDN